MTLSNSNVYSINHHQNYSAGTQSSNFVTKIRNPKPVDGVPRDRGYAYVVMLAVCLEFVVLVGTIRSFGIVFVGLIDYYHSTNSATAVTFSLGGAVSLLLAPVYSAVADMITCRRLVMLGGVMCCIGFAICSLAQSLEQIILAYGLIFGMGCGCALTPGPIMIARYFDTKRSIANAFTFSGSGLGAIVMPYLVSYLIATYSLHSALLILAGLCLHVVVFGAMLRPIRFYFVKSAKTSAYVNSGRGGDIDYNNVMKADREGAGQLEDPRELCSVQFDADDDEDHFKDHDIQTGEEKRNTEFPSKPLSGVQHPAISRLVSDNSRVAATSRIPLINRGFSESYAVGVDELKSIINENVNVAPITGDCTVSVKEPPSSVERQQYFSSDNISGHPPRNRRPSRTLSPLIADRQAGSRIRSVGESLSILRSTLSLQDIFVREMGEAHVRSSYPDSEDDDAVVQLLEKQSSAADVAHTEIGESSGRTPNFVQRRLSKGQAFRFWFRQFHKRLFYVKNAETKTWEPFLDFKYLRMPQVVFFFLGCAMGTVPWFFSMVVPARGRELGFSMQQSSILLSVMAVSDIIGRLGVGLLGDRPLVKPYRHHIMCFCPFVVGCISPLAYFIKKFHWLIVFLTIAPIFAGALTSSSAVVLADLTGPQNLSKCWGLCLFFQGITVLFTPVILGAIADSSGSYGLTFVHIGVCSFVSTALLSLSLYWDRYRTVSVVIKSEL